MGDPKQNIWQEIGQGFGKILIWFIYVFLGVVVAIVMETQQIVISKKKIAIRVILSICAGAWASLVCNKYGLEKPGALIVPSVTIIGQYLFQWIISNWDKWVNKAVDFIFRSNSKNGK